MHVQSSADQFRKVVEAIEDYAIYMLDPRGIIETWSTGAERIKGYRSDEVVGKHYGMFFRSEDRAEGLPMWQLERAKIHGKTEDEGWRVRKDGSVFWANILISAIREEDGTIAGFAKITRDITERQRHREMEHSLRRMTNFLALLGHELRGPLAPMGYAVALLRQGGLESHQRLPCDILDRQIKNLTALLDGLLDAGRLTSGKLRIAPQRIDFQAVVANAVEAINPDISKKSQALLIDLPDESVQLQADGLRIAQVLQNLLSNASKFTPKDGNIHLRAKVECGRLRVTVTDDGVGMDPATIDDLFRLFAQGESRQEVNVSGLGIGLALSRAILEMHGGRISGSSGGPGKGSSFHFELPIADVDTAACKDAGCLS